MAMPKPIIIAGAGISGLLLAQHLRKQNIPFEIYERDGDMTTRGIGWGLTLHWSLPAIRAILPDELVARLPEAYVDVAAIQEGKQSLFPFFDLSTGELKASTPQAREADRIRVSRQRLRELLADGINIKVCQDTHISFLSLLNFSSSRYHSFLQITSVVPQVAKVSDEIVGYGCDTFQYQ